MTIKPERTQSNAQQNTEQPHSPTMGATTNKMLTTTVPPPYTDSSLGRVRLLDGNRKIESGMFI